MNNTVTRLGSALSLLAAVILTGCAGGGGDASSDPVKVGVVLSITGPAGSLGTPASEAVETFKDDLAKADGRRIEWIVEDDASNPTDSVAAVNRLINEGAAAVICCNTTPNSLAIQNAVEQAKLANVALAGAADVVEPPEEKEWFFKTPPTDALTIEVLTDDMLARGIDSAAVFASDTDYGQSGREAFEEIAAEKGIEVTGTAEFSDTDNDMTAQLTQLRRANPDAYVIWGIPPAAAVAQRNLADLGIDQPAYQSFGVANKEFIELAGGAAEGVRLAAGELLLLPNVEGEDPLGESILAFSDQYQQATGEIPGTHAGYAHDATVIVHDAITRVLEAGVDPGNMTTFRERVRDEIENTTELVGVTGVYTYSPTDHVGLDERAVTTIEIQDGSFVRAGEEASGG